MKPDETSNVDHLSSHDRDAKLEVNRQAAA
jgi:hypothetical protein